VNPYTINPPESDVDFEKLCLALLKRDWSRAALMTLNPIARGDFISCFKNWYRERVTIGYGLAAVVTTAGWRS
jgi:hypothetical protein